MPQLNDGKRKIKMKVFEERNVIFTVDEDYPDKIEIGILKDGIIVEGGQFDLNEFMNHVLKFYDEKY